jgi:hypothetical protein
MRHFHALTRDQGLHVGSGSRAAVAGRLMGQPVYPQLRKLPVRCGTYASCQHATSRAWVVRSDRT